jgi:ComF family protein
VQDANYFIDLKLPANLLHYPHIREHLVRPEYSALYGIGYYQAPLNSLISMLKSHHPAAAYLLGHWFIRYGQRQSQALPEYLLPVPISPWRYATRGFNQAALLSQYIGKKLAIPSNPQWAKKQQHRKAQRSLNRQDRITNLKGVYQVSSHFHANHVAIVDDVVTTGATVNALAKLLKRQCPNINIEVWCMAVTPIDRNHTHKP